MSMPVFPQDVADEPSSVGAKSFWTTWILSVALGLFGADHFYLGKTRTGVIKLLTFGGVGIWYLVDLVQLLLGKTTDIHGHSLSGVSKAKTPATVLTIVLLVLALASGSGTSSPEEPLPTLPSVTGERLDVAISDLGQIGISESDIEVVGGGIFGIVDESNWTVCEQEPAAGSTDLSSPRLVVDRVC